MKKTLPDFYFLSPEVIKAKQVNGPIVALETTVMTHGLPYPENIDLAIEMEQMVESEGALPATIGLLKGKVHVGMTRDQLKELANEKGPRKISSRDYAPAIAKAASGGTTVAGTLVASHQVGIEVFATGGIGGVHRNAPFDISADLTELSQRPIIVVCAGAKSILDLTATTEYLETIGVPVLGFKTDNFPAFYSRDSVYRVTQRVDSVNEVVDIAEFHWQIGNHSAVLVAVPPPEEVALPYNEIELNIEEAIKEAEKEGISGQAVTPFLLHRLNILSGNTSLKTNLSLLLNNARVAAQIAVEKSKRNKQYFI